MDAIEEISGIQPGTEIQTVDLPANVNTPPGGYLGKDEFLKLLITQLSFQDPLDPMDSTDSIAQLAQFSALEQMQNVNDQLQIMQHSNALLDSLRLQDAEVEAMTHGGEIITGVVERATWMNGGMTLIINGEAYPVANLAQLRLVTPDGDSSPASGDDSDPAPDSHSSPTPSSTTATPEANQAPPLSWWGGQWR